MNPSSIDYAQLPDELLEDILGGVSTTISSVSRRTSVSEDEVTRGRDILLSNDLIRTVKKGDFTESIVAVDGSYAIERLPEIDIALVQAAGVEGLTSNPSKAWGVSANQYSSWQMVLPHGHQNDTFTRGVMAIMELLCLNSSEHDIRILDGSHIGVLISLDKLLTLKDEGTELSFGTLISEFMNDRFDGRGLSALPDILSTVMHSDSVIASSKYSSSKDILKTALKDLDLKIDDKAFFGRALEGGEYLEPVEVSFNDDGDRVWSNVSVKNRLEKPFVDTDDFNWRINEAIGHLRTRDIHGNKKSSDLFFTYYRPWSMGPVYKLEMKRQLALDEKRLQHALRSIHNQVMFPEIIEPYPQFLADRIAKSVSKGIRAVKDAVVLSGESTDIAKDISILRGYRT